MMLEALYNDHAGPWGRRVGGGGYVTASHEGSGGPGNRRHARVTLESRKEPAAKAGKKPLRERKEIVRQRGAVRIHRDFGAARSSRLARLHYNKMRQRVKVGNKLMNMNEELNLRLEAHIVYASPCVERRLCAPLCRVLLYENPLLRGTLNAKYSSCPCTRTG